MQGVPLRGAGGRLARAPAQAVGVVAGDVAALVEGVAAVRRPGVELVVAGLEGAWGSLSDTTKGARLRFFMLVLAPPRAWSYLGLKM